MEVCRSAKKGLKIDRIMMIVCDVLTQAVLWGGKSAGSVEMYSISCVGIKAVIQQSREPI